MAPARSRRVIVADGIGDLHPGEADGAGQIPQGFHRVRVGQGRGGDDIAGVLIEVHVGVGESGHLLAGHGMGAHIADAAVVVQLIHGVDDRLLDAADIRHDGAGLEIRCVGLQIIDGRLRRQGNEHHVRPGQVVQGPVDGLHAHSKSNGFLVSGPAQNGMGRILLEGPAQAASDQAHAHYSENHGNHLVIKSVL